MLLSLLLLLSLLSLSPVIRSTTEEKEGVNADTATDVNDKPDLSIDTSTPVTSPMASPTGAATDATNALTDEPNPEDEALAYPGPATITMSQIQSNKSIIYAFEDLLPGTHIYIHTYMHTYI